MSKATLNDALSDLCRRAAPGIDVLADGDLLRRFAETRDQQAFAALVRRHGRVVWGAALRRTGDYQTAEDVFQATFLALARRAGRLHGRTSLSGWLYTVAVRFARRAARRTRPVPAEPVADQRPGPLDSLSARELLTALDDELTRLPKAFRLPVVLCCVDGLSRDEAAQRLGCSFGALKGRLERGRELLRRRLAGRGIALSAVLGGLVMVPAAVPPEVAAAATTALLSGTPRPAATALARSLSAGRAAGLVTAVTVALLGLGLTLLPAGAPPADPKSPAKEAEPEPVGETIAVRVLLDGKPVTGAKVWGTQFSRGADPDAAPKPVTTGADGVARLPAPNGITRVAHLFARDPDGRVGVAVFNMYFTPANSATIHLLPVGELTGRFRSADGKPLAGVEVRTVQFNRLDKNAADERRPSYVDVPEWLRAEFTAKTDADGRFRIPSAPVGYQAYAEVTTAGFGRGGLLAETGTPVEVNLQPAGEVRLRLTGPADAAATKGMSLFLGADDPRDNRSGFRARADVHLDGSAEIRVPNLSPNRHKVTAWASPLHPVRLVPAAEVVVTPGGTAELSVAVEPLAKMTGRVIDVVTGKGIPKVPVSVQSQTPDRKPTSFAGTVETDAEGRFVAYGPPGEWGTFFIYGQVAGYSAPTQEAYKTIKPGKLDAAKPHAFPDFPLRPAVTLKAVVVDEAGKPVGGAEVHPARIDNIGSHPETLTGKADGTVALDGLSPEDVVALRVRKGDAVNVPEPVDLAKQDGPATITLSAKNACRVRGRVTDEAGKPLAGAKVYVMWHYQGLGPEGQYSTSRGVDALTTDADGRFGSGALWPKDRYQVSVLLDEYGRAESQQVQGEAGQVHDLGTVKLVATGKAVRGTVVGTDGKPLAGVTVLQRGDGPVGTSAKTGPDGSFTLGGYFDRPGFVVVKDDGYRPTAVAVRPGGEPVTITLRKTSEPPAPVPAMDGHEAALTKFTRSLMETLWADREQMGGFERNVFSDMARYDPATARRWRDEEKKRTNGKTDLTRLLDEAELERDLLALARDDLDELLARLPKRSQWDVDRVATLARKLLAVDKARALRAAEEAAVRARALDPGERPWGLARAGDVAIRAGNEAGGRKLLAEAVELAAKLPADKDYYRGWVAAAVVAHDEPAAFRLIEPIADADRFNEAVQEMVSRLADTDPDRAEGLFTRLRPGRNSSPSAARLVLGFKFAATDPARAEKVVEATPWPAYRLLGQARLAALVAAKDRPRAWRLIDQAMDTLERDPEVARSWSNYGGSPTFAALVAVRAREAGHPDVAGLVARALALRVTYGYESRKDRDEQALSLATTLAFVDPPTARTLLAGIAPPAEFAKRAINESRDWLFAAALADPEHAGTVVDAIWTAAKARRGSGAATSNTGLIELLSILTKPAGRLAELGQYGRIPGLPERE
jgi:RNA polymerase sigma factor (sigma-70 family)